MQDFTAILKFAAKATRFRFWGQEVEGRGDGKGAKPPVAFCRDAI